MSGDSFIQKLIELGIPGSEKLDPSDYDWLFYSLENAPLANFLKWFIENIHTGDVLTDNELKQYEELLSSGKVLSGQQLDSIASCLATLPSNDDLQMKGFDTSVNEKDESALQEDIKLLQDQLIKLTHRCDCLNLHKLELRAELSRKRDQIKEKENSLKNVQSAILNASNSYEKALTELAVNVDSLADFFKKFKQTGANGSFLSQLNFDNWHEEEAKFQANLRTYIDKQFKEGVKKVAGQDNQNEYQLLEVENLDLQLVRGADQEEYQLNVNELQRLSKMLELSEHQKVNAEVNLARKKAEVDEAERFMNKLVRKQLPTSLSLILMNIKDIKESRKLIQEEFVKQMDSILQLSSQVSQSETTRTISGNYQVKLQRQEYFLEKQKFVMQQLVSQLAHYDWLSIAFDLEETIIDDILCTLCGINSLLNLKYNNYHTHMKILNEIKSLNEQDEVLGSITPSQTILKELLIDSEEKKPANTDNDDIMVDKMKALDTSINAMKHQLDSIRDPRSAKLHKMNLKCKLLEECLFSDTDTLTTLPDSWLAEDLVNRQYKVNEDAWKFRQQILNVIRKHEEKKKILEVEPSLKVESIQWAKKLLPS